MQGLPLTTFSNWYPQDFFQKLNFVPTCTKMQGLPVNIFKNWYPNWKNIKFCASILQKRKAYPLQLFKTDIHKIFVKNSIKCQIWQKCKAYPLQLLKTDIHKILMSKNSFSANILQKCKAYPLQLFKNWYPQD